jgi:5'-nucleotidase
MRIWRRGLMYELPYCIGLDIDEVCAQMLPRWVEYINKYCNSNVTVDDIDKWDMTAFVPDSFGTKVYDLLTIPEFYDTVEPMPGYVEGINDLRDMGADIYYVSSCVPGTMDMKIEWLRRHDPHFNWHNVAFLHHKHMLSVDVLVDDAPHNLEDALCNTVRFIHKYNEGCAANAHIFNWDQMSDAIIASFLNPRFVCEDECTTLK